MRINSVPRPWRLAAVMAVAIAATLAVPVPASAEDACVQVYRYPTGSSSSKTYYVNQCVSTGFGGQSGAGAERDVLGTTYGVAVYVPHP